MASRLALSCCALGDNQLQRGWVVKRLVTRVHAHAGGGGEELDIMLSGTDREKQTEPYIHQIFFIFAREQHRANNQFSPTPSDLMFVDRMLE